MPTWSEIESKLERVYRLLKEKGVGPDFPTIPGSGDYPAGGEDVRGWILIQPAVKYVNSAPGDADYKSFTSTYGEIVLSTEGRLYDVHKGWGYSEGRGNFHETWMDGASKERLVGKRGEPFGEIDAALDRIIALHS